MLTLNIFILRHCIPPDVRIIMLCNRGTKLSAAVHQTLFPRSGDVIHPQLWESGSGYETSLNAVMYIFQLADRNDPKLASRLCD